MFNKTFNFVDNICFVIRVIDRMLFKSCLQPNSRQMLITITTTYKRICYETRD